jgi:3-hydroxyisobutyrate dehydrogenase-like beta-hydroxyacid dehydrogenase
MSCLQRYPVGIVGIGVMGAPIASRLVHFGFHTSVYDTDTMKVKKLVRSGALAAESLLTLGRDCSAILLSLPTTDAVRDVVIGSKGLVHSCAAGSLIINLSTVPPDVSLMIQERLDRHSLAFLDAPVSGGRGRAQIGKLTIMASGVGRVKELAQPLLKILGTTIDCGSIPASQIVKLTNQILVASQYAAVVDAIRLAEKSNLDVEIVNQVISQSLGHSKVWDLAMDTIREHQGGVQARILVKDMLIAKEYVTNLGLELAALDGALELYKGFENTDHDPVTVLQQMGPSALVLPR